MRMIKMHNTHPASDERLEASARANETFDRLGGVDEAILHVSQLLQHANADFWSHSSKLIRIEAGELLNLIEDKQRQNTI